MSPLMITSTLNNVFETGDRHSINSGDPTVSPAVGF
jgi:hypothetical protein